jgi:hypothetical protein
MAKEPEGGTSGDLSGGEPLWIVPKEPTTFVPARA